MAESLDKLRAETDQALREANGKLEELKKGGGGGNYNKEERVDLIDIKAMNPGNFGGTATESWRLWSKRVKAYCNARTPGFRKALDWAEAETVPIDAASMSVLAWAPAEVASSKLFDMLILKLENDPLIQTENHAGNGFEAWRSLSRRYDPVEYKLLSDRIIAP